MFSGMPSAIYVHGSTISIDSNSVGVYRGRKADKEMGKSTSFSAICISRRLAERSRGQRNVGSQDGRTAAVVS